MIYPLGRITQDVRVCMDQNLTSDALFTDGDEETLNLDEIIRSKVLEAVRRVHMAAPYWLLEQGHNFGDDETDEEVAVTWGTGAMANTGYVYLPADFMRLVVFEMSDWERAVYTVISVDTPEYAKQRSRFGGIRGTAQRPVCAIGVRPGGRVLEFYSCKSDEATVQRAVYLPYPTIDENNGVDISERCYEAVVYTIAGLTITTCGEVERGSGLLSMANNLLEQ